MCVRRSPSGISIRLGAGLTDYLAYYTVYEDTLRRWDDCALYREPTELLFNARDRAGDASRLCLAEKEGRIVGGSSPSTTTSTSPASAPPACSCT